LIKINGHKGRFSEQVAKHHWASVRKHMGVEWVATTCPHKRKVGLQMAGKKKKTKF
jgi:hypothetical protein